jgi:hypothetical protein
MRSDSNCDEIVRLVEKLYRKCKFCDQLMIKVMMRICTERFTGCLNKRMLQEGGDRGRKIEKNHVL